jgi:hypothetical protein
MKPEINRTTVAMPQEKWEYLIKTKSNIMTRIIYFSILMLLCSCSNNYNQGRAINTDKLVIPDSLFSFFPENKDIQLILYSTSAEKMDLPYNPTEFSITYYMEIFSCTEKMFKKLVDKCMKDTIISYDANGNDFFIVEKERYLLKKYEIDTLKNLYYKNSIDNLSFSLHSALRIVKSDYYDLLHSCVVKSCNKKLINNRLFSLFCKTLYDFSGFKQKAKRPASEKSSRKQARGVR